MRWVGEFQRNFVFSVCVWQYLVVEELLKVLETVHRGLGLLLELRVREREREREREKERRDRERTER